MSIKLIRVFVLAAALLGTALRLPAPAGAAAPAGVTFTLSLKSAFTRAEPNMASQRTASLFQGRSYAVNARTGDSLWVRLSIAGAAGEAWVQASFGTISGDLGLVAVAAASGQTPAGATIDERGAISQSAGPAAASGQGQPARGVYEPDLPVMPTVSQTARDIYQRGLARGNNPRAFSTIGDCQTVPPYFLAAFDYGLYRLGEYAHLQSTIDHFSGSFARQGIGSNPGFNVASVFVPLWADQRRCLRNESPLNCELRLNRPSFAIISMETWWGGNPAGYESFLRRIVQVTIANGTVPILATKADNMEGDGSINAAIVRVAQDYDVPLWNFWAAVQPLPGHGLHPDGFHLTWERNYFDSPEHLQMAWPVRNLTALQALEAAWRGVSGE
jgi:hypothetical protein